MTEAGELFVALRGQDVGLATLLQRVDAQTQKSADNAARLQAQYARLAQAQGNTGQSVRILTSALENNGGASERVVVSLATQLATVQRGPSVYQQFGAAAKSNLLGIIGPAAAAGVAINTLIRIGESFKDAFLFKAQLDANKTAIDTSLKGIRDQGATWAEAAQFAQRYKLTQQETTEAIQASIPILRTSTASIGEVEAVLLRLQAKKPEKTFADAARALDELKAGQIVSIVNQFNISRTAANKMKDEIAKGADAVKLLSDYLTGAGYGMEVLENRTKGVQGGLNELKVAQENLALAQAQFAQGPGITFLEVQTRATTGLTRVLQGDLLPSLQALGQEFGIIGPVANDAAAAWSSDGGAALQTANAHNQLAAATAQVQGAIQGLTGAMAEEIGKKIDSQVETETLANLQRQLEADSRLAAQGLLGAGDQAAILAQKYGIAADQAGFLIQQQQRLANAQALAEQRAGERNPGASGVVEAAAQEDRRLQQLYRTLEDKPKKEKKAHAARLSDQQRLNNQLLASAESYENKYDDLEADHAKRRLEILKKYNEDVAKENAAFAQSQLDTRASFYDQLGGIETKKAGAIQKQASAEYEAAVQEAAQMGGEAGQRYLEAKEQAILARAKRAEEIQKAVEAKDTARATFLKAVDAQYRAAEDAKLKAIKEGGDAAANERDKQLADEDARYQESQDKIITAADRAADAKIAASERSNKKIDEEQARLNTLEATYNRMGRSGAPTGTITGTTEAPANPTPTATTAAAAPAPGQDSLLGAIDNLRAAIVAATNGGADKIVRSVDKLGRRGGVEA